jgi:dihydrofolate reductase
MRTVTYGGAASLDGFLAGPHGALDWLHFSQDVQQIIAAYWKTIDTVLMGRKTYSASLAAQGRPTKRTSARSAKAKAKAKAPAIRTYVFSRTLTEVDDPGVEVVSSDATEFVRNLKAQPGKDICLMGGGELAQSLLGGGVVDKVGLNIHPILLGHGIPVFRDTGRRILLKLTECRPLDGGCLLANYDVISQLKSGA